MYIRCVSASVTIGVTACIASYPLHSVARKPLKRLSLLELTEPCAKAQMDDRVLQRLVYRRSSRAEPKVSENKAL